ncbi:hypothetical protein HPB50_018206 [Hyalomma asiaticum]|uniref:Uncharacterized protein n=1 Tax=Hyalomma asiaticum TaxID=266040 RepID=A0ACB7TMB8_HYAAI|nr:hypothetical protein HPB50_018206 [Hyalomma asiaticum]
MAAGSADGDDFQRIWSGAAFRPRRRCRLGCVPCSALLPGSAPPFRGDGATTLTGNLAHRNSTSHYISCRPCIPPWDLAPTWPLVTYVSYFFRLVVTIALLTVNHFENWR